MLLIDLPLESCEVIVERGLHVLQGVENSKHVNELGQPHQVRVRHKVFPSVLVGQLLYFNAKDSNSFLLEGEEALELVHFWLQNIDDHLIDLQAILLLITLDLHKKIRLDSDSQQQTTKPVSFNTVPRKATKSSMSVSRDLNLHECMQFDKKI